MQKFLPSPGQQQFINDGIRQDSRIDGRQNHDIREYWLSANGSATLQISGSNVQIFVGIKAQVGNIEKNYPNQGQIILSVDYLQNQKSDQQNNTQNQQLLEIKKLLDEFIIDNIEQKQLVLIKGKKCWILYVDVFSTGQLELAHIDQIGIAIKSAFFDLKLPKLNITHNHINDEDEIDLEDENITSFNKFNITSFPVICTIGEVGNQFVVDLSLEEFHSVENIYIVCFDENNNILGIHKYGQGGLKPENIFKITSLAQKTILSVNQYFSTLVKSF